ncbi:MAG: ATP-binding cassette domain-containing protein [Oscillospiraceae bacterium]|nr:ATP-binding cassette domain-containing protein [Oscillospiraceae bacterium]
MGEIIRINGLGKTFATKENEVVALQGVDLSVEEGEVFGIIGLSGAGKSTLVRCMNYLEKPTDGTVVFDGKELGAMNEKELRKARQSISMIFQGFNLLLQRNALQNVCFPLEIAGIPKKESLARAEEMLELVGIADKKHAYPSQLSGGQKQRIAIARALATNPKVLLCDEATSALDPTTTRSILALLQEINRKLGVTIVIITHEMGVIEAVCQRVAILDHSRVAECGKVEDIFVNPQSEIAKQLIYPQGRREASFHKGECLRIVFDGNSSFEPVVSNMVLACGTAVNILFADTKNIDGQAYGQMLLQLPDDESAKRKIYAYLTSQNIPFKEESVNV